MNANEVWEILTKRLQALEEKVEHLENLKEDSSNWPCIVSESNSEVKQ